MKSLARSFLSLAFVLVMFACSSTKYLVSKTYLAEPSRRQNTLFIFLPGRESDVNSFEQSGLLNVARASGVPADCVSVDATYPYYVDRSLLIRLETDVFGKPELARYKNYWFIGNSMGAIGALLYVKKYPGKIGGIILMGPYLGEGPVILDIMTAGSLNKWKSKQTPWTDYINDMWTELKECVAGKSGAYPQIFFISGKSDRYRKIQELLSKELPSNHVFWADGGHDWDAWNAGFADLLKSDAAKKAFNQ